MNKSITGFKHLPADQLCKLKPKDLSKIYWEDSSFVRPIRKKNPTEFEEKKKLLAELLELVPKHYPGYVAALTGLTQYQKNCLTYAPRILEFQVKTVWIGKYRRKIMPVEEKERFKKEFPSVKTKLILLEKKFFADNPDLIKIASCESLSNRQKERLGRHRVTAAGNPYNVRLEKFAGRQQLVISRQNLNDFLEVEKMHKTKKMVK